MALPNDPPDLGAPLMEDRGPDLVLLRSFGYRHEGEFAKLTLEAAGIISILMVDDAGGADIGLSFSNPARLMVREEDEGDAREVLEDAGMMD